MRYLNLSGYLAIPLAFAVHLWLGKGREWEPIVTFCLAGLGVIPLAHLMGEATEALAERTGPTWGGLLNATFGNAAELIIAIIALSKGLNEIVKASLTGSILGNLLLVAGFAMIAGGWKRHQQSFNAAAAEANAGLLALAVAAMLFPAIFHQTAERMHDSLILQHEHRVSMASSVILLIVYGLGLLFTLRTHAHIFSREKRVVAAATRGPATGEGAAGEPAEPAPAAPQAEGHEQHDEWSVKFAIIMLLLASAGIGIVAELLVGSAESLAHRFGWSEIFVGVILLAIVGNAAEHSTAVLMALRDDMDTAMTITYQSSLQIALFAVPALVLISAGMTASGIFEHSRYLDMIFTPMEVAAVVLAVSIVVVLGMDGRTNWFEGVLLVGLYAILAIAFFYLPTALPGATPAAGGH